MLRNARIRRLFSLASIPSWAILVWKTISAVDTFTFIADSAEKFGQFLISPAGDLALIAFSIGLLGLVVLRPDSWTLARLWRDSTTLPSVESVDDRVNSVESVLAQIVASGSKQSEESLQLKQLREDLTNFYREFADKHQISRSELDKLNQWMRKYAPVVEDLLADQLDTDTRR